VQAYEVSVGRGAPISDGVRFRSMEEYRQVHERLTKVFDKEIVFIVGATRWGTAWIQPCLNAHPENYCKGDGHFTDILFTMLARVFDDYNAKSEAVGNRLQTAGLPGNAAERAWEASPLGVNASAWKKKFDDETLRFVNRECGALLKALGLRSLGPRVLSSWVEAIQDDKTLSI